MLFIKLLISFLIPLAAEASDPFELTIKGRHNEFVKYHSSPEILEKTELVRKIKSPNLAEEFQVALNLQSPKAPLAVLIPGTFGGFDSVEVVRLGQLLYQKGFNILRFPNTLSVHMVKHNPKYPGLEFESEAQVYAETIKFLLSEYKFPQVHMIGASYGGFLGVITAKKLGDDFNGQLALISPPKNIHTSLKILDAYFDEYSSDFDKVPWKAIGLALRMQWAEFWRKDLKVEPVEARQLMIVLGFHHGFRSLLSYIEDFKTGGRPWYRFYETWKAEYQKKQNSLRFIGYLKEANPGFFADENKQEVLYWLGQIQRPWLIYTTNDDFINEPQVWPVSEQIIVYKNGGHVFGFMNRPEFLNSFVNFF